jgi:hypothetical protein
MHRFMFVMEQSLRAACGVGWVEFTLLVGKSDENCVIHDSTNFPLPTSSPDPTLGVAAMLAIAVCGLLAGLSGAGHQRVWSPGRFVGRWPSTRVCGLLAGLSGAGHRRVWSPGRLVGRWPATSWGIFWWGSGDGQHRRYMQRGQWPAPDNWGSQFKMCLTLVFLIRYT